MAKPNKALHPTAIPLRFIAAGELDRYECKNVVTVPSQYGAFMQALDSI